MTKSPHGGPRPNQTGRPPVPEDQKLHPHSVYLTRRQVAEMKRRTNKWLRMELDKDWPR